jgi:peptidoglycan/LPS O-acetylase OafA/YrhL
MATHYETLDGLRGIAAYTVVFSHFANLVGATWAGSGAGQVGVMLFFVLSGFLMGRLYLDKPLGQVPDFYVKRFARVVPLYLVLVAASYAWSGPPLYQITPANILEHILFIKGTNVLWTIAVEVQFYAIFPLFRLVYRTGGRTALIAIMIAASVGAFAFGFPRTHALLPHLPYFLAGIGVALLPESRNNVLFFVAFAAYFALMPGLTGYRGDIWLSPAHMILIPALLYGTLSAPASAFLAWSPLRFLGNISYSVYLLHLPVLLVLWNTPLRGSWLMLPVFLVTTTATAWLSFRFFETPMRIWISRAGRSLTARTARPAST